MRLIVIADVHANLPALQAVLEANTPLRADRWLCLGDSVSYNAQPNECISILRRTCDLVVAGNHDRDVVFNEPLIGTSSTARLSQAWTRDVLTVEHLKWLEDLPNKIVEPDHYIAVHGCYLNDYHINGYVTQTMLEPNLRAIAGNPEWPRLGFCAHTHVPMIAVLQVDGQIRRENTTEPVCWPADALAVLINPGSVGQPRDGDPRASFALVDTEARCVQLQRAQYDVAAAMAAFEHTGLPVSLSQRLIEGR